MSPQSATRYSCRSEHYLSAPSVSSRMSRNGFTAVGSCPDAWVGDSAAVFEAAQSVGVSRYCCARVQ
jgi:hypothetical protein